MEHAHKIDINDGNIVMACLRDKTSTFCDALFFFDCIIFTFNTRFDIVFFRYQKKCFDDLFFTLRQSSMWRKVVLLYKQEWGEIHKLYLDIVNRDRHWRTHTHT